MSRWCWQRGGESPQTALGVRNSLKDVNRARLLHGPVKPVVPTDLATLPAFFVFLAAALVFVWRRPYDVPPRVLLSVVVVFYAVLSVPLVPYLGARLLAGGYRSFVPHQGDEIRAVVLLGAGVETIEDSDQQIGLLDSVGAERTLEAARVYRLLNEPWLISSGGSRNPRQPSSAVIMADALVRLGVRRDRILLEDRSITTHDEAVFIAQMLRQIGSQRFVLVTTRSHMPRSEAVFRAQHVDPVPAIVPDAVLPSRLPLLLIPDADGLKSTRALIHEVGGLIYYRVRGFL
jgi:uncharacterized SAM-binding protein YcdF (DUF218 family)